MFRPLQMLTQSALGYLYDLSGDPGAPAPSAGSPTPSPSPAPSPAVSSAPAAVPTPSAAPATAPTSAVPDGYVPSYRLREIREAATREREEYAARVRSEYESQLNQVRAQLQALVGVSTPQNPEVDTIRSQFAKLFPKLAQMEDRADDLFSLAERAGDLEQQTEHYWQAYGRTQMDRLFTHAADELGAPLNDEAKRALHSSFVGFVQSSPELTARYAQDPSLVDDFWKAFSQSFISPARRASQAAVVSRAGGITSLPQDAPSGVPAPAPAPKPANLDERVALAWAHLNANKG